MTQLTDFLDLPDTSAELAEVLLLPLPFEATVSFGHGTAQGPETVWEASRQVELFDELTGFDLQSIGYHSAKPVVPSTPANVQAYLQSVDAIAGRLHQKANHANRSRPGMVIGVGGEHSLTPALVDAAAVNFGFNGSDLSGITIVQFDAHADLRDQYQDTPHSHACAMRRLTERGASLIAIGIRSMDSEELAYAQSNARITLCHAGTLMHPSLTIAAGLPTIRLEQALKLLAGLTGPVYLSFDIDALEIHLCPNTGTPEPGGLDWWTTIQLLQALLQTNQQRQLIGMDLVETVPHDQNPANAYVAAKLLTKMISFACA